MSSIIIIIAMWALTFAMKETDGPFDIIRKARGWLLRNQAIGVYIFNLLQCYFCLGAYSGLIVYLLAVPASEYNLFNIFVWMLAGAGTSYIFNSILERISHRE